jgi:hypothetical protein
MTLTVDKIHWREAVKLTLPKEHGLALAAVSGFFLHRPMKLLSRKNDPRQPLAATRADLRRLWYSLHAII